LLAGLILVSSFEFLKLAHAATPDATLIAFVVLYLTSFWLGHDRGGRSWFIPCGIASALAVLTKGPVGLVLPGAIVGAYLLAQRELSRVWDRRLVHGVLAWILVAVPWYAIVTAETRGEWLKAFIIDENLNRAAEPKENHSGWPVVYYLICLCLFFAPWSSFLYVTVREAYVRAVRSSDSSSPECRANRFLLIWIAVYFLAFSFAATKLPNYIAPLYPALAILAARWLLRWMRGEVLIERWLLISGQLGIGLTGLVVLLGFLVGGGVIPVPGAGTKLRIYPGLETWAWIGLFPILGAGAFGYFAAHQQRDRAVLALTSTTLVFLGLMAAFPFQVLDRYKAAKPLVIESEADRVDVDQRLGSFQFTQPSLVFYSQRRVEPFGEARTAADFLSNPHPSVLFVPQPVWESAVLPLVRAEYRIVSQHYDFSRNCNILAVRNRR
jgi:4-amino-4-deoxy-L-arabinose transferase-like glycosyltransferase